MIRLTADFSAAFSRDLKKKAKRRNWDLNELQKLIDLVLENTPESLEILKRRHNMNRLSGSWAGRNECHVANFVVPQLWQNALASSSLRMCSGVFLHSRNASISVTPLLRRNSSSTISSATNLTIVSLLTPSALICWAVSSYFDSIIGRFLAIGKVTVRYRLDSSGQ